MEKSDSYELTILEDLNTEVGDLLFLYAQHKAKKMKENRIEIDDYYNKPIYERIRDFGQFLLQADVEWLLAEVQQEKDNKINN